MARIDVDGIGVAYEIVGDDGPAVAITPGGRFSKDTPGVRELAEKLVEGGLRAVIWDRPNTGESDISFEGESESVMNADALAGLIRELGCGPAVLVGGSAGSRVSLIAGLRHPDQVAGLFLLWISGGPIGLATLAVHYCAESALAANSGGMEAVAELRSWQEPLQRNAGNRDRLLGYEPRAFIETMQRWADSFFPQQESPVPGLLPADFQQLKMPVQILRSGPTDLHHTRATTDRVHELIPDSVLAEPPWGENEWNERLVAAQKGEGLFARWPLLAPQILEFVAKLKR